MYYDIHKVCILLADGHKYLIPTSSVFQNQLLTVVFWRHIKIEYNMPLNIFCYFRETLKGYIIVSYAHRLRPFRVKQFESIDLI